MTRSCRLARTRFAGAAIVVVAAAAATNAMAQGGPPIKPGLWEIQRVGADGKPMADDPRAAAMKDMKPEVRARMEAMMKEKGISIGDGRTLRVCLTSESLDRDAWQQNADCKTEYSQRTASAWKWHATCPTSEIDGEAVFASPERYSVRNKVVSKRQGAAGTHEMNANARWLGAACGDIKPMLPAKR